MAGTEMKFSRRLLLGTCGAVVAAGGTAFALRGSGAGRRVSFDAKTFNRGNMAEPDTLDPHLAASTYENNVVGDMFLGLMTEDAAANAVPGAALGYTASPDGLVYTFKIRDHKWSDGVPVTAQDFVFSIRRLLDPKTASQFASILFPIVNAEAVNAGRLPPDRVGARALDDKTLEIAFHIQVPYVAQLFSHYATFAVPQHIVERHGNQWLKPENIVTNGAYVLKEWIPNDHILLVKNPHFYDAANVSIEQVYFFPTADYSAAMKRFRAGELDTQNGVPPQEIGWIRSALPGTLHIAPIIYTRYLQYNFTRAPFNDWRVRAAVSLAIDREIIARKVMRAGELPAFNFVPHLMPDYPNTARLRDSEKPMAWQIAKARALLKEAGYGPSNPLTFDYNIHDTTDVRLCAVALQAMWKDIGAEVQIIPSDEKDHYNLMRRQDFMVGWAGWVADYRDAKDFLFLMQSTTKELNYGRYSNPKYDAAMTAADHTRDPMERGRILAGAEQVMLDNLAITPIYFGVSNDLVALSVKGWQSNPMYINRTRYVSLDRKRAFV
jgi:oligopeptide transport system substrate-binding protein